ncbi:MAG: hypothetical protein JNG90_06160, partial [Planctomycetaceae bacterium]|nr:hypothetical protein [Planctomycetaceae bacterium]
GGAAVLDETCYLWRHHATTGTLYSSRYDVYVPCSENRFACFGFKDTYANGVMNFAHLREGVPVVNTPHGSLTKTGSWASFSESQAYGGSVAYSSAAATETISGTIAGHTLLVRAWLQTTGGYALVTIDGSPTAANRCPRVTQAQVDAGYFAAADLGKCYVDFSAAVVYGDEHLVLAEGLSDTDHVVTLSGVGAAQIPPPGATGKLLNVAALAGARYHTRPTDANASMGFTRDVSNIRGGHSATTVVVSFAPTGFLGNQQLLGENHLFEAQTAAAFTVDGAAATLEPGAYLSGQRIVLTRTTLLNHPNAAACATKRVVYTACAANPMQLVARGLLAWNVAGEMADGYFGMLPVFTRNVGSGLLENLEFDRGLVGERVVADLTPNAGAEYRVPGADILAVYSTRHDTVALAHMSRPDLNVNNFVRSDPAFTFLRDVGSGGEKGYFTRSTPTTKEPLAAGATQAFEVGWRVFRLARARQLLELAP